MMNTSFLDYYKMILDKVSFDPNLFLKEYNKAIRSLHNHEIGDLNRWLQANGLHAKMHGHRELQRHEKRVS